ncbi:MAG: HD domain-containing phosphohydrolase [Spirochaetia bacterium]|nr:HD domain-containing protein [Spirochaetota bacterium]MDW8112482.1 HD domain-containing phosphohydrolase [Spirochaetia bacterium]
MSENVTNDIGEISEVKVPIKVSKFYLKEGDILDENILYYDNLKKGLILDKSAISAIQNINEVKEVRVLRSKSLIIEEEKQTTPSNVVIEPVKKEEQTIETLDNVSDVDIKMAFNDEKLNRKIAEAIRNTIQNIRGQDYDAKVDETSSKIENMLQKEQITTQAVQLEAQKIIRDLSQSFVDNISLQKIVPIKSKKEVLSLNFSNKSISNYFLDIVIEDKVSFVSSAKSVVLKFINAFGDDNSGIMLSSLFQLSESDDYVLSHSIFVMALSIMVAKELTKIVYDKLLSNQNNKIDTKSLKVVSLKTFGIEDLTNIGLASLLHDIGIRKNFGIIPPSYKIPPLSRSKIDLHPSESSYIVQKLNLDISIQRAIYEHHEYLDGSGYPKGANKYLSKYSPILAFVERFGELVLQNPLVDKTLPPPLAINNILKNEIRRFDKDVVYAFIRATSTYPIGSWIQMSDGMIGFVKDVSQKDRTKQVIKVVFDNNLRQLNETRLIDLGDVQDIKIAKIMNPVELSQKVGELRRYYFD